MSVKYNKAGHAIESVKGEDKKYTVTQHTPTGTTSKGGLTKAQAETLQDAVADGADFNEALTSVLKPAKEAAPKKEGE